MPQDDADAIHIGQTASIVVQALPLQTFTGTVAQTAGALDPSSRTLVAEIELNNPNGVIRPGMFADVKITVPQTTQYLTIPDPAVLTSASGPQVVVIGENNKIHYQNVTIGQDNGATMQIVDASIPATGSSQPQTIIWWRARRWRSRRARKGVGPRTNTDR